MTMLVLLLQSSCPLCSLCHPLSAVLSLTWWRNYKNPSGFVRLLRASPVIGVSIDGCRGGVSDPRRGDDPHLPPLARGPVSQGAQLTGLPAITLAPHGPVVHPDHPDASLDAGEQRRGRPGRVRHLQSSQSSQLAPKRTGDFYGVEVQTVWKV